MAFSVHLLPRDLKWDWKEDQHKADWGQNSKFLDFSQISSQSQPSNCDSDLVQLAINILKCGRKGSCWVVCTFWEGGKIWQIFKWCTVLVISNITDLRQNASLVDTDVVTKVIGRNSHQNKMGNSLPQKDHKCL